MVALNLDSYLQFLPTLTTVPDASLWLTYDDEADVLYVNFKRPSVATDSELTDDDVIVRYEDEAVVGYTILHARQR